MMLEQKKISSKINYDVLKDLNVKPGASPAPKVESPKKEPTVTRISGRNRKLAPAPLSLSTPLSTLGKRWVSRVFFKTSDLNCKPQILTEARRSAFISC